jgi:hypothetical protein
MLTHIVKAQRSLSHLALSSAVLPCCVLFYAPCEGVFRDIALYYVTTPSPPLIIDKAFFQVT